MKRSRLRKLAITLPGVYALLPTYGCVPVVDSNGTTTDVRRVNPDDIHGVGGNRRLAKEAIAFAEQLSTVHVPGHLACVGIEQPTLHTVEFRDGTAAADEDDYARTDGGLLRYCAGSLVRRERFGDGTVSSGAAATLGAHKHVIAQQHGALPMTPESLAAVKEEIKDGELGVGLGEGEFGIDVPDEVRPEESWPIRIRNVESPLSAECEVIDLASDRRIANPRIEWIDGSWRATARVPSAGLYEVRLTGGSASPVRQLVLAADDDE